MATLLVFAREVTLEGLIYPAGAIVPAGVLSLPKLMSLRQSNRIVEVREEELREVVFPHRPAQLDPKVLQEAVAHRDKVRRELDAAEALVRSLEAVKAADEAPIDPYEPETRGVEVDLRDVAAEPEAPATVEPEAPAHDETPSDDDPDVVAEVEEDPFGDELLAPQPKKTGGRRPKNAEPEDDGKELPGHLDSE